jgi:hypothetical protein
MAMPRHYTKRKLLPAKQETEGDGGSSLGLINSLAQLTSDRPPQKTYYGNFMRFTSSAKRGSERNGSNNGSTLSQMNQPARSS